MLDQYPHQFQDGVYSQIFDFQMHPRLYSVRYTMSQHFLRYLFYLFRMTVSLLSLDQFRVVNFTTLHILESFEYFFCFITIDSFIFHSWLFILFKRGRLILLFLIILAWTPFWSSIAFNWSSFLFSIFIVSSKVFFF